MIFGREPAVWLALLKAVLAATIALGWWKLSQDQTGAILAIASGVTVIVLAFHVHPFPPQAIANLGEAVAALTLAFHTNINPEAIASIVVVVQMVVALASRQSSTPVPPADSPALAPRKTRRTRV